MTGYARNKWGFWRLETNRVHFIEKIAQIFNIHRTSDWYNIKLEMVLHLDGGGGFLKYYGGSLQRALTELFPNGLVNSGDWRWEPWRFDRVRSGFWEDPINRRAYIDSLAQELSIQKWDEWYSVKTATVVMHGGSAFLRYYGNSLSSALKDLHPEYLWQPWQFGHTAYLYWSDEKNVQSYLRWLSENLQITNMYDWRYVSTQQISRLKGSTLLKRYGNLSLLFAHFFPHQRYGEFDYYCRQAYSYNRLDQTSVDCREKGVIVSKAQLYLWKMIGLLFPECDTFLNYKYCYTSSKHVLSGSLRPHSRKVMEFDLFVPMLSLVLEYHGGQHYYWHFVYGSPEISRKRDQEKKKECDKLGLTLIEIPYWRHFSPRLLSMQIQKQRPDLLQSCVEIYSSVSEMSELTLEMKEEEHKNSAFVNSTVGDCKPKYQIIKSWPRDPIVS